MRSKPCLVLKYWLLWILFFEAARLLFLAANFQSTVQLSIRNTVGTLFYGLRMDLSMAAYITLPVCLFLLIGIFINFFNRPPLYKIYTGLLLLVSLLMVVADINLFKAWGSRLDATPLKYLSNPKEAWASVSYLPIFWIILGFIIVYAGLLLFINRIIERWLDALIPERNRIIIALLLLFAAGLSIIPIRGGFQLAPLNQSSVYFSADNYANQAAINPVWNFLHSLDHNSESKTNPFNLVDGKQARITVNSLFQNENKSSSVLKSQTGIKPNVIFIIWESFTEKATHLQRNGIDITPKFNELKKEGIYFSNIYAAGDRTDKGIVAILSGYPSQPTTSIVKTPGKAAKLPMISKLLYDNGYNTSFYYGGELEFANMKAYLLGGKFKKFTSKDDFAAKDQNSKWGAHDGVVMRKVISDLEKETPPFFSTWLTLSSHEPFEVPVKQVIIGADHESLFLNSLHYTDEVVYNFIKQCKQMPWWDKTLIVITADHGHRMPATGRKIDDFKMPVLLLGGILNESNSIYNQVGSQVDIPATVLGQLQLPANEFKWSKNLMDSTTQSWAYFCFNNGYGFVQQTNYYIFDNVGRKAIGSQGNPSQADIIKGKSMQQLSFQDYLGK